MKKHMIRMALAGALALGVASVSKADDTAAAATAPVFSGVAQELATQSFGTLSKTSTTGNATSGDQLGLSLQHVQIGANFNVDSLDTVTVRSELATGALQLMDAYDVHSLADLNAGLAVKAGQIRIPFGVNAYANPDDLIRVSYSVIDALVPAGKATFGNANGVAASANINTTSGNTYDLGVELDQTFSDLTLQVAAVQNPNAYVTSNTGANSTGSGTQFDYVARGQWKGGNLSLGLSDYYQSTATGPTGTAASSNYNNVNTLGANASVMMDIFTLDLEAIWGPNTGNGYTAMLSAKTNGIQPAVWYEFLSPTVYPASTSPALNGTQYPDLGAGVNLWLGSKTRLALDVDFTGTNTQGGTADLLAVNSEKVQLQEVF